MLIKKKSISSWWQVCCCPACKVPNNIIVLGKSHYIYCLKNELGIDNSLLQRKRNSWTFIDLVFFLFNINQIWRTGSTGFLSCKQRYAEGSTKCFTKHLSTLLTFILITTSYVLWHYLHTEMCESNVDSEPL